MSAGDSLEYQSQLELFDEVIGIENTEVINGRKYSVPLRAPDTHPFYNSSEPTTGTMRFRGQQYFNLSLLYDIYSDELVVHWLRSTGAPDLLMLNKVDVESFAIDNHRFENYQGSRAIDVGIDAGFYDVLFANDVFHLIARRKKKTQVDMGRIAYQSSDQYLFILDGRKAAPFRGMKNFYDALGGNKEQILAFRSFVNANKLNIRKSERDLVTAARYCDSLLGKQK